MDLGGRGEQRVVKAMAGKTGLAIGQKPACANGDVDVDRMDSVAEGRDETIEPVVQGVGAFGLSGAGSLNCGLELDERGRRQKNGILVGLDPVS